MNIPVHEAHEDGDVDTVIQTGDDDTVVRTHAETKLQPVAVKAGICSTCAQCYKATS